MAKKLSNGQVKFLVISLLILIIVGLSSIAGIVFYTLNKAISGNNNSNVATEDTDENTVESNIEYEYPTFDNDKILKVAGDSEDKSYNIKKYDALGIFSAAIKDNKVYFTIEDLNEKYDTLFSSEVFKKNVEYNITTEDLKVIDVHIGYIGTDFSKPILLILESSGKVYAIDVKSVLEKGTITLNESIANNIVRIEDVEDSKKEKSIILIRNDKTIYDVKNLI